MTDSPRPQPSFPQFRSAVPLAADARQVVMLVNRKAGTGRRRALVEQATDELTNEGLRPSVVSDIEEFRALSIQALEAGDLRAAVSCGGDGTVSAVLNTAPLGTPIAILPMGTENLLARYLGHRRSAASIVDLLTHGVVVPMDAGQVDDRLFAIVLSAGFDAEIVRQVHANRTGNITHLAYVAPVFKAIAGYRFPKIRVTASGTDGQPFTAEGCWSFAVNLPSYALQLPMAPQATGNDGLLDLCVFERGSFVSSLWYLSHILRRRHHQLDCVHTAQRQSLRFEALDSEEIPYQIDGDPGGVLPVEVTSIPGRMPLVVAPTVAKKLGFSLPANQRATEARD